MSETTTRKNEEALNKVLPSFEDSITVQKRLLSARTKVNSGFEKIPENFRLRGMKVVAPSRERQPAQSVKPPTLEEVLQAAD